ncbi:MAG: Rieske 2Fe-2S domain-containing protein, partial [Planctomycetota bacterium]
MLIVCRKDLTDDDFRRLESKLADVPFELRWARRAGRLVLLCERARGDEPELVDLAGDPAVEYLLRDPTREEITRLFSRRDVLDLAIAGTGLVAAAAVLAPLGLYVTAPAHERSPRGERWLAAADSIPVNGSRSRVVDGEELLIVRRDEARFHALSGTCTHSEVCLVEWDP